MPEITLHIDGMHCGSCIRRVSQAIANAGPFQVNEVRLGAARFSALAEAGEAAEASTPNLAAPALAALAKAA
jgi:hypothetical protein